MQPLVKETVFKHKERKLKLSSTQVSTLCNQAGLAVFLTLVGYFVLMRALGLHEIVSLRTLNAVFLIAGIVYALYTYSKNEKDNKIDYFEGLKMGVHITLVAVVPFVLVIYLYLANDDSFLHMVKSKVGLGEFLTAPVIAGALFIEGLSSGLIITFMTMQYFKK